VPAAVVLRFEPYFQVAGLSVPWRGIGIAAAVLAALAVGAFLARRSPDLRLDDMLYLVVGAIPGAVIGGRLVHGLAFLDTYARQPAQLLDPAYGSLSLLGAVVGGAISAAVVARMLEAPMREWADAAAAPLLLAIGLGKLALVFGGGGQGVLYDGPWAVAFTGPGPWLSAAADVPAHPSQVYEGLWALLGLPLIIAAERGMSWRRWWTGESYGPSGGRPGASQLGYGPRTGIAARPSPSGAAGGSVFGAAVAWWLAGRFIVGFTWRDERGFGPLGAEQALSLVALGVVLVLAVALNRVERRSAEPGPRPALGEDPAVLVAPAVAPPDAPAPVTHAPALSAPTPLGDAPVENAALTQVIHPPASPSDLPLRDEQT
jgi:prolipoprotein diacylglyceryltransferase